jgi:hypothetical protein
MEATSLPDPRSADSLDQLFADGPDVDFSVLIDTSLDFDELFSNEDLFGTGSAHFRADDFAEFIRVDFEGGNNNGKEYRESTKAAEQIKGVQQLQQLSGHGQQLSMQNKQLLQEQQQHQVAGQGQQLSEEEQQRSRQNQQLSKHEQQLPYHEHHLSQHEQQLPQHEQQLSHHEQQLPQHEQHLSHHEQPLPHQHQLSRHEQQLPQHDQQFSKDGLQLQLSQDEQQLSKHGQQFQLSKETAPSIVFHTAVAEMKPLQDGARIRATSTRTATITAVPCRTVGVRTATVMGTRSILPPIFPKPPAVAPAAKLVEVVRPVKGPLFTPIAPAPPR